MNRLADIVLILLIGLLVWAVLGEMQQRRKMQESIITNEQRISIAMKRADRIAAKVKTLESHDYDLARMILTNARFLKWTYKVIPDSICTNRTVYQHSLGECQQWWRKRGR